MSQIRPAGIARRIAIALVATALGAGPAAAVSPSVASAQEISTVPTGGAWTVDGRGNGHGHGLSQYGAQGAAIAGLSAPQIISFYYPGTILITAPVAAIRVELTDNPLTTVASAAGLSLTGAGALAIAGVSHFRLVPAGAGFTLQKQVSAAWSTAKAGLASRVDFSTKAGSVRALHADGSYTDYRGSVGAVRNGTGQLTINRLPLDSYLRGVLPREMPSSWRPAAVQAQAIAARSYARYAVEHNSSTAYDMCDSTSCQVYGGMNRYNGAGQRQYGEEPGSDAAVAARPNVIAIYQGRTIFAQFSASNGGVSAAGSAPYLVTRADPNDNVASGDPYLGYTRTATAAKVATFFGLARVTRIRITARAGGGVWGGIVTAAAVDGTNSAGASVSVQATGPGLASALGMNYQYLRIRNLDPIGAIDGFGMIGVRELHMRGWVMDPMRPGVSAQIHVYVGAKGTPFVANLARPDVQRAYGTGYNRYGYDVSLIVPGGTSNVCAFAIDATGQSHTSLGCRAVSVPVDPLGHLDSTTKVGSNVRLAGWAFDPDSNGGVTGVHVYVDKVGYPFSARLPRPDVQRAFNLANDTVGFRLDVPVPAGRHGVCAYAINTAGSGSNRLIRCTTVVG